MSARARRACDKHYDTGKALLAQAIKADEVNQLGSALTLYGSACEHFILGLTLDRHPASRQYVNKRVHEYLSRAELLKVTLKKKNAKKAGSSSSNRMSEEKKVESDQEEVPDGLHFADVAGMEFVKDVLKETVMLPMRQPHLFSGARKPWKGILLYGPPGTGKTMVAEALANESKAAFVALSSGDIMSKFQGESEKAIRKVFEYARSNKPCIIFLDEIDSLGGSRSGGSGDDSSNESSRRVLTELLKQMDGVGSGSNEGVTVVAATNRPTELDSALRRRFEKRVYVPLPDVKTRSKVLQLQLGGQDQHGTDHVLRQIDFDEAARRTEGYSNADLAVAAKEALMAPVRQCVQATHFKEEWSLSLAGLLRGRVKVLVPCSPNDQGAKPMRMMEESFDSTRLRVPPVTKRDLQAAVTKVKPSVSQESLKAYAKFTELFGSKEPGYYKNDEAEEEEEEDRGSVGRLLPVSPDHAPTPKRQVVRTKRKAVLG